MIPVEMFSGHFNPHELQCQVTFDWKTNNGSAKIEEIIALKEQ
jgi:hypothetical protein